MSRHFVYSDPHFGHENIIKYENRPFSSVEEMNLQLVKNWNKVVSKGDTVFVLGDIAFKLKKEEVANIIKQLNGKKILILGNHDRSKSVSWWLDVGFHTVSEYPICYKWRYWLSHEPLTLHPELPYINIHGHTHSLPSVSDLHINVCVEQTDYKPLLLDLVISKFEINEK